MVQADTHVDHREVILLSTGQTDFFHEFLYIIHKLKGRLTEAQTGACSGEYSVSVMQGAVGQIAELLQRCAQPCGTTVSFRTR